MIARMAVPVAFAIGLIVLVVIGNQVVKRKSIMSRDEIDAGPRFSPPLVKQVARAGDALGQVRELSFVALPEPPHGVAKLVVPFRPARRELADLITAGAD